MLLLLERISPHSAAKIRIISESASVFADFLSMNHVFVKKVKVILNSTFAFAQLNSFNSITYKSCIKDLLASIQHRFNIALTSVVVQ